MLPLKTVAIDFFKQLVITSSADGHTRVTTDPSLNHIFSTKNSGLCPSSSDEDVATAGAAIVAAFFNQMHETLLRDLGIVIASEKRQLAYSLTDDDTFVNFVNVTRAYSVISAFIAKLESVEDAIGKFDEVVTYCLALFMGNVKYDYLMTRLLEMRKSLYDITFFNTVVSLNEDERDPHATAICSGILGSLKGSKYFLAHVANAYERQQGAVG